MERSWSTLATAGTYCSSASPVRHLTLDAPLTISGRPTAVGRWRGAWDASLDIIQLLSPPRAQATPRRGSRRSTRRTTLRRCTLVSQRGAQGASKETCSFRPGTLRRQRVATLLCALPGLHPVVVSPLRTIGRLNGQLPRVSRSAMHRFRLASRPKLLEECPQHPYWQTKLQRTSLLRCANCGTATLQPRDKGTLLRHASSMLAILGPMCKTQTVPSALQSCVTLCPPSSRRRVVPPSS